MIRTTFWTRYDATVRKDELIEDVELVKSKPGEDPSADPANLQVAFIKADKDEAESILINQPNGKLFHYMNEQLLIYTCILNCFRFNHILVDPSLNSSPHWKLQ